MTKRTSHQRQKLSIKPSMHIIAGSLLSLAICSVLLWAYLVYQPEKTVAEPDSSPDPALAFEFVTFQTLDSIQFRPANFIPAKPLIEKRKSHIIEEGSKNDN